MKSAKEVLAGGHKWTGDTTFTIAQHCNVRWTAFIALGEVAANVAVQIPAEQTVLAALSLVRQDELVK